MWNLLLLLGSLLISSTANAAPSFCDTLQIPECKRIVPRDIIFLVDGSNSMDMDRFYGDVLNYTLALYCAFQEDQPNKAGMVLFNERVEVIIPMAPYTRTEWYNKVYEVKNSRNTANPACCSCCTPTADAFRVTNTEFDRVGNPNPVQMAFVITDGVPSNNRANTGGYPEYWWHDAATGFDPARYSVESVPTEAQALKDKNRRVILVGVPNRDMVPPDQKYFDGRYANGYNYCTTREGVKFCGKYYTNPPMFPIVSLPVQMNSFSTSVWNSAQLLTDIIEAVCFEATKVPTKLPTPAPSTKPTLAPTQAPTKATTQTPTLPPTLAPTQTPTLPPTLAPTTVSPTKLPTKLPTLQPTKLPTKLPSSKPTTSPTAVYIDQVDLTFLVDRSNSMTYHPELCKSVLDSFPPDGSVVSPSPCWQLWTKYLQNQATDMSHIRAGEFLERELGWASSFDSTSVPRKGLRVNVVGFACTNKQKTPKMFDYSRDMNGGPITSLEQLIALVNRLRSEVIPDGGTCPHLAVEQAVKYVEATTEQDFPLQTVILMTDGVFYDGDAVPMATRGLESYKVLNYAVGISIAQKDNYFGMTPAEIETQRFQLTAFVGGNPDHFYNLQNGWSGLLNITATIAESLPAYYFDNLSGKPVPRYDWCGFRRKHNCESDNGRNGHCRWKPKFSVYGCARVWE